MNEASRENETNKNATEEAEQTQVTYHKVNILYQTANFADYCSG
jgi:hypothetical protein